MNKRSLVLVAICSVLLFAPSTPVLRADEPSFEDLTASAWPVVDDEEPGDVIEITGTLKAGVHDPCGKNEYSLVIIGSRDGTDAKRLLLGVYDAEADVTKEGTGLRPGETVSFTVELPAKFTVELEHRYIALALMEKDHGLGIGSLDVPFMVFSGGAPDKVAVTDWLSVNALKKAAMNVTFGPTWTGAHLTCVMKYVAAER